jgi:hypothetical protein
MDFICLDAAVLSERSWDLAMYAELLPIIVGCVLIGALVAIYMNG